MQQLRHFIKTDTKSKNLTDEQIKQLYEWEKEDAKYETLCEDCLKNKKVPGYDLCLSCGRKNKR